MEEREVNTEIAELAQELMHTERLPIRHARERAEREYESLQRYGQEWDQLVVNAGNLDGYFDGAIPF